MPPLIQADRPGADGDGVQQEASRHLGAASEENLDAYSSVSGEQFIQWQRQVTATRLGKGEKLKQESLAAESSAERVRQLKTENEQLVGKGNQLSEELKTEEMLLINTNAQLAVLEEQLQQVGVLGQFVRQLQDEEERTKSERSSRMREIEERFQNVKVSESDARAKLDAEARSTREKLEENSARVKQGLDAVEEKHTELVQAQSNQTCQGRKLGMELEAGAGRIKEQEMKAKARKILVSDVKSANEAKALEVNKNDDYLESLIKKTAADEDSEMRLLMGLKDRKGLVQEKMSNAEKDVDQLRRSAAERQHEMANLEEEVGNLEAEKANRAARVARLQKDIFELKELTNVAEQGFVKEKAAEERLVAQKKTQQEKFREEEKRVELQGQLQLTGELLTKKKVELKALESQVESEEANLQKMTIESEVSNGVLRDLMAANDKLQSTSFENQEILKSLETKMKGVSERLGLLKVENDRSRELAESFTSDIADKVEQNEFLEEQLRNAEAEKVGETKEISTLESERKVLVEGQREAQEEILNLEHIIPVKEEELGSNKERSTSLTVKSNQLDEENNAALTALKERTTILRTIGCDIDQLKSKTDELKLQEEEVVGQVAQALAMLEQGTKTQAMRGAHENDLKQAKKLQKTTKQAKGELSVILKRKEKLERQRVKSTQEKSKLMKEVEQIEAELVSAKENIATLSSEQTNHDQALLARKEEMEQCRLEAADLSNQGQALRNRATELKDDISRSEALLKKERGKVEEQGMVLEEKQRKGEVGLIAIEAECSGFGQNIRTKLHHLEQSQGQKQQLVDDLENAEQEGKRLKQELELMEKAPTSRRTPQPLRRSGTSLPLVKRREAETGTEIGKQNGTQEGFTQFRTPSSIAKRAPLQADKSSPAINRGKRTLLQPSISQPPKTPTAANQVPSVLKASPLFAAKSPFEVASPSSDTTE